jgi:hypothetical protein
MYKIRQVNSWIESITRIKMHVGTHFGLPRVLLCSLCKVSYFSLVVHVQSWLRFCTVQVTVMEQSEHEVLFQVGQNDYWNFPADETGLWWQCFLSPKRLFEYVTDFGTAVKRSKMTNSRSKQFGNWFQLIVELIIGWWKRNSKLAKKQFRKS